MMADQQFSLVWNSFPTNLSSGLFTLLNDEQLVDVTLAAEGKILRAHKLILSVCSTYFRDLFQANTCKHPIVILKDVNYRDISAMLRFMYQGEVNIKQEDLASFLKVAETLQVKGLTKDDNQKNRSARDDESKIVDDGNRSNSQSSDSAVIAEKLQIPYDQGKLHAIETALSPTADPAYQPANTPRDNLVFLSSEKRTNDTERTKKEPGKSVQALFDENMQSTPQSMEEPLDYTSDLVRVANAKSEPLDYTSDVDLDLRCIPTYNNQENISDLRENDCQLENHSVVNDFLQSNSQLAAYNSLGQDEATQPFSHLESAYRSDFPFDAGNYTKGRRTVKGIPGSSLSLETTLRVVSELGPTVRVECGKVIRMYSCPWCLRHFTRKENLKLHVRYIHGPLESLTCKLCGNKYKNSNSLRVHSYLYHNTKRNKRGKPPLVASSK